MPDNSTLIAVSAFSGLAGALLTQAMTGLFAYFSDKRRVGTDLKNQYRNKQIEIAENFYFMTGEAMNNLRKSINYWKNRNDSRSEASLNFMREEMRVLDVYLQKLNEENWKHNLVGLYFHVSLSYSEIIATNTRSHAIYLNILDIAERIKKSEEGEEKDKLYGRYNLSIFDLCTQYQQVYDMLAADMDKVRTELLNSFK